VEYCNCKVWAETEAAITNKINARIHRELLVWECQHKFFEVQRPRLIDLFEHRFTGIKTNLASVETMISHHDPSLPDSPPSPLHANTDESSTWGFPGSVPFLGARLHWTQKLAIGLAAPLLVPLALAAALLGLPIVGGLAARELVVERRSEGKAREYRADRVKYLVTRTLEQVQSFGKSAALDEFVAAELRPALHCVEQLRQQVRLLMNE
jgi:hypothetical protein